MRCGMAADDDTDGAETGARTATRPHGSAGLKATRHRRRARRNSKDAENTQTIPRDGRMLPATTVGSATPVPAAIHKATQTGHFGSKIAIAPGSALPAAFSHRRPGPSFGGIPHA